jgi:polypeptide N-acetylgalactosaminyltransferase
LKIRNQGKNSICIDSQEIEDQDRPIIGYPCHGQGGNQYFLFTKTDEIRRADKCLDFSLEKGKLREPSNIFSMECHQLKGNQMWSYVVRIFLSFSY